nr:hypothetical protein [Bacteroidota bacterium]
MEYFDMNIGDIFNTNLFYIDGGNSEHYSRTRISILLVGAVFMPFHQLTNFRLSSFYLSQFSSVSSFPGSGTFTIIRDSFPFYRRVYIRYRFASPYKLISHAFAFSYSNFNDNPLAFSALRSIT